MAIQKTESMRQPAAGLGVFAQPRYPLQGKITPEHGANSWTGSTANMPVLTIWSDCVGPMNSSARVAALLKPRPRPVAAV